MPSHLNAQVGANSGAEEEEDEEEEEEAQITCVSFDLEAEDADRLDFVFRHLGGRLFDVKEEPKDETAATADRSGVEDVAAAEAAEPAPVQPPRSLEGPLQRRMLEAFCEGVTELDPAQKPSAEHHWRQQA